MHGAESISHQYTYPRITTFYPRATNVHAFAVYNICSRIIPKCAQSVHAAEFSPNKGPQIRSIVHLYLDKHGYILGKWIYLDKRW